MKVLVRPKAAGMQVDKELQQLVAVLPDVTVRLERIKATLLVSLLTKQDTIAENLVALRRCLPGVDAGALVLRFPEMLTQMSAAEIEAQVDLLRCVSLQMLAAEIEAQVVL